MKILILNAMGRSGTTMLQDAISNEYGIKNLGEYLSTDYESKLTQLSEKDNWVSKFFIEKDYTLDYVTDIVRINPDIIVNSYRENKFDQYLSFQVSLYNEKWNSDKKMKYQNFTIAHPRESIKYFKESIELFDSIRLKLLERYDIVNVSYEQILSDSINNKLFKKPPVYHTAKQNTLQEKLNLIKNFNEVCDIWNEEWQ